MSNTLRTLGVAEFKLLVGAASFDILVNPHTQKLFASGSNGMNYKVEAAIDFAQPIVVLMDGDDLESACFINKRSVAEIKITL